MINAPREAKTGHSNVDLFPLLRIQGCQGSDHDLLFAYSIAEQRIAVEAHRPLAAGLEDHVLLAGKRADEALEENGRVASMRASERRAHRIGYLSWHKSQLEALSMSLEDLLPEFELQRKKAAEGGFPPVPASLSDEY